MACGQGLKLCSQGLGQGLGVGLGEEQVLLPVEDQGGQGQAVKAGPEVLEAEKPLKEPFLGPLVRGLGDEGGLGPPP